MPKFSNSIPKRVSDFSTPCTRVRALPKCVHTFAQSTPDDPPQAKPIHEHCENVQVQAMILNKHPWTSIQSQLPNWTLNTVFINDCLNNLLTYFYKQEEYSYTPVFLLSCQNIWPHCLAGKKQGGGETLHGCNKKNKPEKQN